MRKLSLLLLLISLLALLDTLHSQPQGPQQVGAMWLVLTWPNGFCSIKSCNPSFLPQHFVTHGLWPQPLHSKKRLQYCSRNTNISPLLRSHPALQSDLLRNWPTLTMPSNLSFWNHEWNKHGSCSRMNQLTYFQFGATGFPDMLGVLGANGVFPGGIYPQGKYEKAIQARTGPFNIYLRCENNGKDDVLLEIYICFDALLKSYVSCPLLSTTCGPAINFL